MFGTTNVKLFPGSLLQQDCVAHENSITVRDLSSSTKSKQTQHFVSHVSTSSCKSSCRSAASDPHSVIVEGCCYVRLDLLTDSRQALPSFGDSKSFIVIPNLQECGAVSSRRRGLLRNHPAGPHLADRRPAAPESGRQRCRRPY